jgi:stress responsive alpha/beta barrel protein
MKPRLMFALAVLLGGFLTLPLGDGGRAVAAADAEPMIVHNVYFSLRDDSGMERKKLVEACKKYLSEHAGTVYFSAGILAEEFDRDANDRDFDVALHIVFKNKEAHDKYQASEKHKQFINENRENWKKVRVFDSKVTDSKSK